MYNLIVIYLLVMINVLYAYELSSYPATSREEKETAIDGRVYYLLNTNGIARLIPDNGTLNHLKVDRHLKHQHEVKLAASLQEMKESLKEIRMQMNFTSSWLNLVSRSMVYEIGPILPSVAHHSGHMDDNHDNYNEFWVSMMYAFISCLSCMLSPFKLLAFPLPSTPLTSPRP